MIVETSSNQLYLVIETNDPNLAHVWHGVRMKRSKGGAFVQAKDARRELVRKAGCRVVQEVA